MFFYLQNHFNTKQASVKTTLACFHAKKKCKKGKECLVKMSKK
jgi:hypothetical protein